MNTDTSSRLALALMAAITATIALSATFAVIPQDGTPPDVVKLERVVVVGERLNGAAEQAAAQHIETLPRVVIEGRRADADVRWAKASCAAPLTC